MMYYNNNPKFGEGGPFEATSLAELADAMHDVFATWAREQWMGCEDDGTDEELWLGGRLDELRTESLEGFEEYEELKR